MPVTRWCLMFIAFIGAALIAHAQVGRFRGGDLVQFDSDYGPVIGEVIGGPDPSNYFLLAIPGREDFAIHAEKLRVLQRAGAPEAQIDRSAVVGWKRAGAAQRGRVVKINGAWCQVQPGGGNVNSWIECSALVTAY